MQTDTVGPEMTVAERFDVANRTVLITGASRGIGFMMAQGFVEGAATVYVTSREHERAAAAAARLSAIGPGIAIPLVAELGHEAGCRALAEALGEREEALDVLVNNAAATAAAPVEEHEDALWDPVLDVALKGVFHTIRFLLPLLRAAGSAAEPARIINVSSAAGTLVSQRENFGYSASKAGVNHLTRQLALRLAPEITVNAIAPGVFLTQHVSENLTEEFIASLTAHTPMARPGAADDLAAAALYLATGGAYVTGTVLALDGGMSITTFG